MLKITVVIKSGWMELLAYMGKTRNPYKVLMQRPWNGKGHFGHIEVNKIFLKSVTELWCDGVSWIELVQIGWNGMTYVKCWWTSRLHSTNFFDQMNKHQLFKKDAILYSSYLHWLLVLLHCLFYTWFMYQHFQYFTLFRTGVEMA